MSYTIQLPDESKTLVLRDKENRFMGQATYWKRNGRWEMIGVTRHVNWLHDVAYADLESEIESRGAQFRWVKSLPFCTHSFQKEKFTEKIPK